MQNHLLSLARKLYYLFKTKQTAELGYWQKRYREEGGHFHNDFYPKLMLGIAREPDDSFMKGLTVADFGCGPRGTLVWAKSAAKRIGIDVLADKYLRDFPRELAFHGMQYINSTEQSIPLPDASIDVLYTLNSLDHVADLPAMCSELRRILKPGGELMGSFNLRHESTKAEPQVLSEALLQELLFKDYQIISWRVSAPDTKKGGYPYEPLLKEMLIKALDKPAVLWARAKKVL